MTEPDAMHKFLILEHQPLTPTEREEQRKRVAETMDAVVSNAVIYATRIDAWGIAVEYSLPPLRERGGFIVYWNELSPDCHTPLHQVVAHRFVNLLRTAMDRVYLKGIA